MSDPRLTFIRDLIQQDVNQRGLRRDAAANLVDFRPEAFAEACQALATAPRPALGIVTGFFIPHAQPPAAESDGPLGALFLARALVPLGMRVVLATDAFARHALAVGLAACGLQDRVPLVTLPPADGAESRSASAYWNAFAAQAGPLTHLLALERVGPAHTPDSLRHQGATEAELECFRTEVTAEHHDRCHTMRGEDVTAHMSPSHYLFEAATQQSPPLITLGIGDGGNEIGMGAMPWEIIRRNIPNGAVVACRVPVEHLIVCGISNWGAYGLAAGVRLLVGRGPEGDLFDVERERQLLRLMVEQGPLVDGVTGRPTLSVDGLEFDRYAEPLRRLGQMQF